MLLKLHIPAPLAAGTDIVVQASPRGSGETELTFVGVLGQTDPAPRALTLQAMPELVPAVLAQGPAEPETDATAEEASYNPWDHVPPHRQHRRAGALTSRGTKRHTVFRILLDMEGTPLTAVDVETLLCAADSDGEAGDLDIGNASGHLSALYKYGLADRRVPTGPRRGKGMHFEYRAAPGAREWAETQGLLGDG